MPSKQLFLKGMKVHCIHKKILKNSYVVEYKWSKYYVLAYNDETFMIHRDKVHGGWVDWKSSTNTSIFQLNNYPLMPIKMIEFQ